MGDNDCFYNPSSDEHWEDIYGFCKSIRRRMVEVPGGDVNIAGKMFHVGTFKIARTLVSVSDWAQVMGLDIPAPTSRRPMTGISWCEIHNFYQHLKILASFPGQLTFPTEAQLVLARQRGLIKTQNDYREFCFTEFRTPDKMGNHHFDNLPGQEPFHLVVRSGDTRSSMLYTDSDDLTGFRMALVDYQPVANEDIEQLLRLAGIPE